MLSNTYVKVQCKFKTWLTTPTLEMWKAKEVEPLILLKWHFVLLRSRTSRLPFSVFLLTMKLLLTFPFASPTNLQSLKTVTVIQVWQWAIKITEDFCGIEIGDSGSYTINSTLICLTIMSLRGKHAKEVFHFHVFLQSRSLSVKRHFGS